MDVKNIMLGICTCECDNDCAIWKYLIDCKCMESLVDDPVVTCDEVIDNSETFWINPNDFTSYWLIAVVLVAMTYLLLLIVIAPQYA